MIKKANWIIVLERKKKQEKAGQQNQGQQEKTGQQNQGQQEKTGQQNQGQQKKVGQRQNPKQERTNQNGFSLNEGFVLNAFYFPLALFIYLKRVYH